MASDQGDREERELSNWLEDEAGWFAQRTGSSGAATDRARPDVIASRAHRHSRWGRVAMIEVKGAADGTVHLDSHEVEDLVEAANRAGAGAWVAIKPDLRKHDQWHVFGAGQLHETDGGNYSVRKSDLPGQTLEEVFG